MTALLSLRDLVVEFVDRGEVTNRPIRGVDLELGRGEVLGVVGETGCGKTLTGLSVLGLLPTGARTTGQVVFDGVDQLTCSERERAALRGDAVSMVFQNPGTAFNPVFTIGSQMRKVLRRHRSVSRTGAAATIRTQLERVGLPDPDRVAAAYPHELSGGMLQRAMIATALLCEPELLVMDEPTTALDVTIAQQILRLILELQADLGFSVLLITHNLEVVNDVCDRVAVLYAGRVVEAGPTADVLGAPAHPYTRGLLGALPSRRAAGESLVSIRGSVPGNLLGITGCSFADRCPFVVDDCRNQDPTLLPLTPVHEVACIRSAEL
ncbi:MAG: ABC transporter ATP-binding protein [Nocardioidaceae bacterium]